MTGLAVAQWGGHIYDSATAGNPVEVWTNSIAFQTPDAASLGPATTEISTKLQAWFTSLGSRISATVRLEYLKVNSYDLATGHQITDPTNDVSYLTSNLRGPEVTDSNSELPITTSVRVSIDDETRSRTHRGGFFVPRVKVPIGHDGRIGSGAVGDISSVTTTFLSGLGAAETWVLGVWSRKDHAVHPVSRLRVGNVPDNISKRKNAIPEAYTMTAL